MDRDGTSRLIQDYAVSNTNEFIAYSSLVPYLHLAKISDGERLVEGEQRVLEISDGSFGLFCVRFSGDGKELVCGSNDGTTIHLTQIHCIFTILNQIQYHRDLPQTLHRIEGHRDDVNSVAFISPSDSNVVVSASDDSTVKVWDRRAMKSNRPSGVLIGRKSVLLIQILKVSHMYQLKGTVEPLSQIQKTKL